MSQPSSLQRIVMRLARNPGAALSEPDDHRGYALVAPLAQDGSLDRELYERYRQACTVRSFAPDREPRTGRLTHQGARWLFDYDPTEESDDEAVYRLGDHCFTLGAYISLEGEGGELLTYKVTAIEPVTAAA